MSWRISNVTGSLASGRWLIAGVTGALSIANSAWRILDVRGTLAGGAWRIANVSGSLAVAANAPTLAAIPTQTTDPVQPVTITAVVTNGLVPDSYSFTSPGITFSVTGNTATFLAPGTPTGGTVTVTVTATAGGTTSAPRTATVMVNAALGGYKAADATIHGISYPYHL